MSTVPFSYHLFNTHTKQHYYGIKYSKGSRPEELWVTYFSSSKVVRKLIETHGADSFTFEVRRTFSSGKEALLWENRVIRRLKVTKREDWINRHDGGTKFRGPEKHSDHTKKILQKKITGIKRSSSCKEKHSKNAIKREQTKRDNNWKMPEEAISRAIETRSHRIASGEIDPYSAERNAKMAASKKGTKRHYLPDGSFVMIKIQADQ